MKFYRIGENVLKFLGILVIGLMCYKICTFGVKPYFECSLNTYTLEECKTMTNGNLIGFVKSANIAVFKED